MEYEPDKRIDYYAGSICMLRTRSIDRSTPEAVIEAWLLRGRELRLLPWWARLTSTDCGETLGV